MPTDGLWQDMFDPTRRNGVPPGAPPPTMARPETRREEPLDDDAMALDLSVYKPWVLQRGRSRPAMMLDFRTYEPRSGMWSGWAVAYPHLVTLEYVGDRLVSLDFGGRLLVLEGTGLDELVRHIQQGSVVAIQQYTPDLWSSKPTGPSVMSIRQISKDAEAHR
jgi:hypothetical protein